MPIDWTSPTPDRNESEDDDLGRAGHRDEQTDDVELPISLSMSDVLRELFSLTVRSGRLDETMARRAAHEMASADIDDFDAAILVNATASGMVDELTATPGGGRLSVVRRAAELMSVAAKSVMAFYRRRKQIELADRADSSPLSLRVADLNDPTARPTHDGNRLYIMVATGRLPEGDQLYRKFIDAGAGSAIMESTPSGFLALQRMNGLDTAVSLCRELLSKLPSETAMAVEPLTFDGPLESFKTAEGVLRLAAMFDLGPGLFQIADFPVEFAVATTPSVREKLLNTIRPVMAKAELRRTLELLVFSQGNRTRAAERLHIHRSTIDYRLHQIDRLTGHSPVTTGGLNMLTMSLAVHTLMT